LWFSVWLDEFYDYETLHSRGKLPPGAFCRISFCPQEVSEVRIKPASTANGAEPSLMRAHSSIQQRAD
jgi:hypothetical protein